MRERPFCRKMILHLCEKHNCSIQELIDNNHVMVTHNLKVQARIMLKEGLK